MNLSLLPTTARVVATALTMALTLLGLSALVITRAQPATAPRAATTWSDFSPGVGAWIATLPVTAAVTATDADGLTTNAAYRASTDGGVSWSTWLTSNLQIAAITTDTHRLNVTNLNLNDGANFIQFRIEDLTGVTPSSPAYPLNVDTTAPSSPLHPQPQPASWTKTNNFGVTWTNPNDPTGIDGAWYKLDAAPTNAHDGAFVAGANLTTLSGLNVAGDGAHPLWLWLADGLGHADHTTAISVTLRLDTQPPDPLPTAAAAPAAWTNTNSFDLTWALPHDPSGISGVRYKLDAPPVSPPDGDFWPGALTGHNHYAIPGNLEGNHQLWLWPVDGAGNAALPISARAVALHLDTTPPGPPVTVPIVTPAGWQTSATATFTVTWQNPTDLSGIGAACYKLGAPPASNLDGVCVDGVGLSQITGITPPGPGSSHLFLWLRDGAGNLDKDRRGVTLDAVRWDASPPELFIDASGSLGLNSWFLSPVNLNLIATDIGSSLANVEYNLDNTGWTTGRQLRIGADGQHTLLARAADIAGNRTQVGPNTYAIDTQPPTTTPLFNHPSPYQDWYSQTVTITLATTDATSGPDYVEWRLDDSAWQRGATVRIDAEGPHTLSFRSADRAGNISEIANRRANIDRLAPITSYVILPPITPSGWYTGAVNITLFPADEGNGGQTPGSGVATTLYRIDGGSWQTGTTISLNESGEHSVEFYSLDRVGNAEAVFRIPGGIRIDVEAPRSPTPLDTAPRGWNNRNDFDLTLAVPPDLSGIAGAYVKVGAPPTSAADGVWRPGSSNLLRHIQTPAEGRFKAYIWLRDIAGNADPNHRGVWEGDLSLAYDATPPHTTAKLEGVAGAHNWFISPVRVSLVSTDTLSGVTGAWVSIDGAQPVTQTQFTLTTADKHTLLFHSNDAAGNVEDDQLVTVRIDPDPPSSPQAVATAPHGWTRTNSFTLTWTNPPDTSGIASGYYKIGAPPTHTRDGVAVSPIGVARGISVPAEGAWDIYFWLVDQAGNADLSTQIIRPGALRYDGAPPTTTAAPHGILGANGWYTSKVIVQLAATDQTSGIASMHYRVDSGDWIETNANATLVIDSIGQHLIEYQATDAAGNTETLSQLPLKIDLTAPWPAFPAISRYQRQTSFVLTWSATDEPNGSGLDGFDLQYKDGRNAAWTAWGAPNVPDTSGRFYGNRGHRYFFRLRAHDHAGNTSAWIELPWGIYIDSVADGDFAGGSYGAWRQEGPLDQIMLSGQDAFSQTAFLIQLGNPNYGPNIPGHDIPPNSSGNIPIGAAIISQPIRIPGADALDHPTLTLWYRIYTYDTKFTQDKWFDTLDVRLIGRNGEWLALRDGLPRAQWVEGQLADMGWRHLQADIPPSWLGDNVTLSIENWNRNDGRLNTWSLVTDIRLWEPYRTYLPFTKAPGRSPTLQTIDNALTPTAPGLR